MKVAPIYGSNLWTGHDRLASAEDRIASSADGRHGISSISDGMVQTGHEHRGHEHRAHTPGMKKRVQDLQEAIKKQTPFQAACTF